MCNFVTRRLVRLVFALLIVSIKSIAVFANPASVKNGCYGYRDYAGYIVSVFTNNHFPANDTITYTGSPVLCNDSPQLLLKLQNVAPGSTVQWLKNNAVISGANSASYLVTSGGIYSATVTSNGLTYNYPPVNITTAPRPVAGFSFPQGVSCASTAVQFTSTSTGGGLTYAWNFGDPNSKKANLSKLENPSHLFVGTAGNGTQTFTVALTVTNKYGCSNTYKSKITLLQTPDFSLGGDGATVYNGGSYFVNCTNKASWFTFTNTSTTNNVKYNFYWGDGHVETTITTFKEISHVYKVGSYTMYYTVYGANGCSVTHKYHIFVGKSPKVAFAYNTSKAICTGSALILQVTDTRKNTRGTTYTVTYSDGTVNEYTAAPDTLMHTFFKNSVNKTTFKNNAAVVNAYGVIITADNPCGSATDTLAPIYVSDHPNIKETLITSNVTCVNTTVRLKNESDSASYASATGAGLDKFIWKITPATGFIINKTVIGSYTKSTDPSTWTAGVSNLQIIFTNPGSYKVTLVTGNGTCGLDSASKIICVNPLPLASFDLDKINGCVPLLVTARNTSNSPSCGKAFFSWKVVYSGCDSSGIQYAFAGGTSATSVNPKIQFNSPGIYTVTLIHTDSLGGCTSAVYSQTVTVGARPSVVLTTPTHIYKGQAFKPSALINNCTQGVAFNYAWTFAGATTVASSLLSPDSIVYKNEGQYLITLTVSNECGITTLYKNINVILRPALYIPNTFTPNRDGINDTWNIRGLDTEPVKVQIYDRYGALLFERSGLYQPWDGTYNNARLPVGTYYYIIRTLKSRRTYEGPLTLIY